MKTITITRRSLLAATGAAVAAGIAGCGTSGENSNGSAASSGKSYKIGVLQYTQHNALDAANKGFIKALDEAKINYKSGLVKSNDEPGVNVTGASDMNPVEEQIDMLHKVLPDAKKVGMLFCTAEANSEIQIKMAEEACDALGLEHERYTVSSSNEIQSVVESMVGKVDAGYSPTDNTIAAAAQQVGQIAKDGNLPFVCGEENMCMGMGICTISIDYEELGHMAGEMALKILTDGADPATMAIETESKDQLKVVKNEDMAKALGIDLSVLD